MNLLAIDTATLHASIALKVKDSLLQAAENELNKHAAWVLPTIDHLLRQANIQLSDLDGIVYGQGPGSFTGLRVACSFVKGLATGADLPVYPVSTLQTIATAANEATVLAVIDARMQAWYFALFEKGQAITKEQVAHPSKIQLPHDTQITLAGVGYEALYDELPKNLQHRITSKKMIYPDAKEMILMVEHSKIPPVSAAEATLHYIRQEVTHG